ncbi:MULTISPECIES: hypothetical protein [Achromobacter]|uniref:hypothetical protein n=1 Tax=Achromobacter TaxID=222 RepID=UPI0023F9DDDB|nr:hypothetical protein [Achromobacter anxifer]MDF8362052.1 hypothetical protein [Achromobacter anxifer]
MFNSLLSATLYMVFLGLFSLGLILICVRFKQLCWLWAWLVAAIFFGWHKWEERTLLNERVPTEVVLQFSEMVQSTPEWDSLALILANGDLTYRDFYAIQKAREGRLESEEAAAHAKKDQERTAQRNADMQALRARAEEHREVMNGGAQDESKRDGVAEDVTRTTSDVSGLAGFPACNVSRCD